MQKLRLETIQKAQGMVEFALVLPILLLIILGIIGFGHLFFVYSSTVSASREAARFGAAVGVTGEGLPRFQDCDSIRGVAIQRGLFAGVTNDADVVAIEYDQGPDTGVYGNCPVGGTGPDVALGDRIIVTVNVQYQSIVPIVNIPSFPLTAVTRRTIIRSLQVGEAPTAEPICPLTFITMTINGEPSTDHVTPSVVGQPVQIYVEVVGDDGTYPENDDSIEVTDSAGNVCTLDAPSGTCVFTYWHPGDYTISAQYFGDICYEPSYLGDQLHQVVKADTVTTITSDNPDYSTRDQPIMVYVSVRAVAPGVRASWEGQSVTVTDGTSSCEATLNAVGDGGCPIIMTRVGMNNITATYPGDADYNPSSDTEQHLVYEPTPTLVLTPTLLVTPTRTPLPPWCPNISGGVVFTTAYDVFHFDVRNPGTAATDVTAVEVNWPGGSPIARLSEIRFDTSNMGTSCTDGGGPDCIWESNKGLNPPSQYLNSSTGGWTTLGLVPNETKEMRMVFSHNLKNGPYRVVITFSNNCILELEANRLITN